MRFTFMTEGSVRSATRSLLQTWTSVRSARTHARRARRASTRRAATAASAWTGSSRQGSTSSAAEVSSSTAEDVCCPSQEESDLSEKAGGGCWGRFSQQAGSQGSVLGSAFECCHFRINFPGLIYDSLEWKGAPSRRGLIPSQYAFAKEIPGSLDRPLMSTVMVPVLLWCRHRYQRVQRRARRVRRARRLRQHGRELHVHVSRRVPGRRRVLHRYARLSSSHRARLPESFSCRVVLCCNAAER